MFSAGSAFTSHVRPPCFRASSTNPAAATPPPRCPPLDEQEMQVAAFSRARPPGW
ncbi:hypothetical protein [Archangium sp.]|uniref:hypothetical protein n=1 Tax=Archangium sp. TaxID=1872627 RepID=UPI002D4113DE|nr:hypothetical protein [Archangium sp.]HYO58445.1 hypothetical protein [Archangium sp.]